jgi:hypothetical protein
MNEREIEKDVEKMYEAFNPKNGITARYFRNYIRKRKIKNIFNEK